MKELILKTDKEYYKEINKEYENWLAKIRDKYLKEMLENWAEYWALFSSPSEVMSEIEYLLDKIKKWKKI